MAIETKVSIDILRVPHSICPMKDGEISNEQKIILFLAIGAVMMMVGCGTAATEIAVESEEALTENFTDEYKNLDEEPERESIEVEEPAKIEEVESFAESSKQLEVAINTSNDKSSFKEGYLSGKLEQTLIEEFIVEVGAVIGGKDEP